MGLKSRGALPAKPNQTRPNWTRRCNSAPAQVAPQPNPNIRFLALIRLALPSILLQSGAPLAITFQTALIGRKGTDLVAAWAIVATATNAATVVFNFLVVGVTAKVTKVVAVGAWAQVGSRIRLALGMALTTGLVACAVLLCLQKPLWLLLDVSSPDVLRVAEAYFYLRIAGVPPQLMVMCTSGILQGYKRVNLVAFLQGLRVILDVCATYVSLYVIDWDLVGVGLGTIFAAVTVAASAFTCILMFPPLEGRHKIHILSPLFPSWLVGSWKRKTEAHERGDLESVQESLLPNGVVDSEDESERMSSKAPANAEVAGGAPRRTAEEEERLNAVLNESMWKFVWDGLSTMLRSALVQASFFMVLACATVLGKYAVAAHQVLMQLWMINIYIADGFATAGTIVGSSLAGHLAQAQTLQEKRRHLADLRVTCWRVLYLGAIEGVLLASVYFVFEEGLMDLFTHDPGTKAQLRGVWLYLVLVQPLNSIVFVYDGLIYAAQAFSYMAACLTVGFFTLFIPCILLAYFYFKTLLAAWFAKGVLNVVRFVVAGYKIHYCFLAPDLKEGLSEADDDEGDEETGLLSHSDHDEVGLSSSNDQSEGGVTPCVGSSSEESSSSSEMQEEPPTR